MILIPKYYGIEARDYIPVYQKVRGEYRAILTGPDGRVKHDSGWKSNKILDTGLYELLTYSRCLWAITYGDSDAAVSAAQTGLQGNIIPKGGTDYVWRAGSSYTYGTNSGNPDYAISTTESYIALEGECTGTIKEFCTHVDSRSPVTQAATRVVLDTPIVKGADDVLTMEYRFTTYLDLTDKVSTIDISGEVYNYTFRRANVDYSPGDHEYHLWTIAGSYTYFKVRTYTGVLGSLTEAPGDVGGNVLVESFLQWSNDRTGLVMGTGGTPGNYYRTLGFNAGVDDLNGTFDVVYFNFNNNQSGCQFSLDKVSDGTGFTKENTHEFGMQMRLYLQEYTP